MSRWKQRCVAVAMGALVSGGAMIMAPERAEAFCGFYVSGGESELFNNATQVALMREGTKTVLSMQNDYEGPIKDFAMVVPVPVVLMQDDVKTLPKALFDKLDTLTAPRLVEYYEQDPCTPKYDYDNAGGGFQDMSAPYSPEADQGSSPPAVVIEAQFTVGEYDIVILSATEANALSSWLTQNHYTIPQGAEPIFSQYIAQGQYFFVAKVDPAKVTFEQGKAVLSPLRFSYDSDEFALPIRLGMVNSAGAQDLIVYLLSREGRYEAANYANVTIPTNLMVAKQTESAFGDFYSKLFTRTLEQHPGSVVTEYSWDAGSCDPCPGPVLEAEDYATLGSDVIAGSEDLQAWGYGWTLTRLHARYGKNDLSEDLVFRKAPGISGGRGIPGSNGTIDQTVSSQQYGSTFQGRYIMLERWSGSVTCDDPQYGVWGEPPGGIGLSGSAVSPNSGGVAAPVGERMLDEYLDVGAPDTSGGSGDGGGEAGGGESGGGEVAGGGGCMSAPGSGAPAGLAASALLALAGLMGVRRRRR